MNVDIFHFNPHFVHELKKTMQRAFLTLLYLQLSLREKKPLYVHRFLKIQQIKVFLKPQLKGKGLTL